MAYGVDGLGEHTLGCVTGLVTEELVGLGEVLVLGAFFIQILNLFNESFYFFSNGFDHSRCRRRGSVIGHRMGSVSVV